MRAIDLKATRDYVPLRDRKLQAKDQTIFVIGTLSFNDRRIIRNELVFQTSQGGRANARQYYARGDYDVECVRRGIVTARNFMDHEGKQTKLERVKDPDGAREILSDDALDLISPIIPELATQVREFNTLRIEDETDDEGNSDGSETAPASES